MNRHNLLAITGGALAALCVFLLLSLYFQKTAFRVLVEGFFYTDTKVTVSTISKAGKVDVLDSFEFLASEPKNRPDLQGTGTLNIPIGRLRFDFEAKDKSIDLAKFPFKLENFYVKMPLATDYHIIPEQIDLNFRSNTLLKDTGTFAWYGYEPETGSTTLESIPFIGLHNRVLTYGLSALFFIGIYLLIKNSAWAHIPAFSDMALGNKISSSAEFNSINGLRGLAALLVLFSHTAPGWEGLQIGLGLLFVISGFLLSKPFVLDNSKIFSLANLERYTTKRLKRILPMYYLFIFMTYVLTFKFDVAMRHFLFIQAEGHLWPMTQIFAFYMLLPFILLISCASHRVHRLLPLALLAIAVYYSLTKMGSWEPFFNGNYHHDFALYAFLTGVFIAYLHYDFLAKWEWLKGGSQVTREVFGLLALVVTMLTILWSAPLKPPSIVAAYMSMFYVKCVLCAVIILLAVNSPGTMYNRLMSNWLFRSVGVVGFSFYILHGLGMQIVDHFAVDYLGKAALGWRSWGFMFASFCVTYLLAIVGYSYVERPFFGYRERPKTASQ